MHSEKWKDMHDGEARPLAKGPDVILSAACNPQWWSHRRAEHAVTSSSRIVYAVTPPSNGRGCLGRREPAARCIPLASSILQGNAAKRLAVKSYEKSTVGILNTDCPHLEFLSQAPG